MKRNRQKGVALGIFLKKKMNFKCNWSKGHSLNQCQQYCITFSACFTYKQMIGKTYEWYSIENEKVKVQ